MTERRCGTCEFWTGRGANADWRVCEFGPIPFAYRWEPSETRATDGTTCPTWAAKKERKDAE